MKITDQTIPEELALLYGSLVSTKKTGAHAGQHTRTRRGARIRPSKKQAKQTYNDISAAVEELMVRLGHNRADADFASLVAAEKSAINAGVFNPAYWIKCDVISTDYLSNEPSSTADAAPPPYGYRDSNNMPSLPVYGSGSAASAPARYAGATSGELFRDTLLVWSRTIYDLQTPIGQDQAEPAIIAYEGTLTVAANMRGSRPMLSIVLRCYLTDAAGASLTTTANPVLAVPPASPPTLKGCNSLYWRYVIPTTAAPFFNTVKLRKILRNLAQISTIDAAGDMAKAVIMTAPRPMFGRGFNNNTTVSSSLTGVPDIYQINKPYDLYASMEPQTGALNTWNWFTSTLNGKSLRSKSFVTRTVTGSPTVPEGRVTTWSAEVWAFFPLFEKRVAKISLTLKEINGQPPIWLLLDMDAPFSSVHFNSLTNKYTWRDYKLIATNVPYNVPVEFTVTSYQMTPGEIIDVTDTSQISFIHPIPTSLNALYAKLTT